MADRVCVQARRRGSVSLTRFAFQACSFNHSDISPLLESTTCERSKADYRTRRRLRSFFLDHVPVQRFAARERRRRCKLCQTSQCRAITYGDFVELPLKRFEVAWRGHPRSRNSRPSRRRSVPHDPAETLRRVRGPFLLRSPASVGRAMTSCFVKRPVARSSNARGHERRVSVLNQARGRSVRRAQIPQ